MPTSVPVNSMPPSTALFAPPQQPSPMCAGAGCGSGGVGRGGGGIGGGEGGGEGGEECCPAECGEATALTAEQVVGADNPPACGDNGDNENADCGECAGGGEGGEGECTSDFSAYPVRYFDGEIRLISRDLSSAGFGLPWGHTRSYSNRVTVPGEGVNGNSWFVRELPYLVADGSGNIAVVSLINDTRWFDHSSGTYTGRYYLKETLTHDSGAGLFILQGAQGPKMKFYDFAHGTAAMRGQLKSYVDAGGREITASYGGNHLISSFVQSSGGDSNGYYYDYTSVGGADRLEYVTLKVDASNVRRVEYDYYDGSDSHGSAGDLRRARIQEWDGSAWNTKSTHYYRYYKSGDTDGVAHGVKYVQIGRAHV